MQKKYIYTVGVNDMIKIFITGIVASGKTTLARKISKQLDIPFYELDCIVHVKTENGRYKRTPEEQVKEIQRINDLGDWIIEGTPRESCRCLFDLADKVVFLDLPLWIRKKRILTRFIKQQLHIESCHYTSNLRMLKMMFKWTRDFENNWEQFEKKLKMYNDKLIKITNDKDFNLTL